MKYIWKNRKWTKKEQTIYDKQIRKIECKKIPKEGDLILVWNKQHFYGDPNLHDGIGLELGVIHTIENFPAIKFYRVGYVTIDSWYVNHLINQVTDILLIKKHFPEFFNFSKKEQGMILKMLKKSDEKKDNESFDRFYRLLESNAKYKTGTNCPWSFILDIIERGNVKW